MSVTQQKGSLRIIAGKWKRHIIHFSGPIDLRPTPDSVRETVFNWLTPAIQDATCLDLFSGSGALGFEAASRGAGEVYLVDDNYSVCAQLLRTRKDLSAEQIYIYCEDALRFLESSDKRFNIIFLDPPFQSSLSSKIFSVLEHSNTLFDQGLVYLEQPKNARTPPLSHAWEIYKENTTRTIKYSLYRLNNPNQSTKLRDLTESIM